MVRLLVKLCEPQARLSSFASANQPQLGARELRCWWVSLERSMGLECGGVSESK
jgi:hypothetical protein